MPRVPSTKQLGWRRGYEAGLVNGPAPACKPYSVSCSAVSLLAQVVADTYTECTRLAEAGGRVSQGGLRTLERVVVLVAEILHVGIQVDVGPEDPIPESAEVEHGVGGCRVP